MNLIFCVVVKIEVAAADNVENKLVDGVCLPLEALLLWQQHISDVRGITVRIELDANTEVLVSDCQWSWIRLKINGFSRLAVITTLSVDEKLIGAVSHDKELSWSTKSLNLILIFKLNWGNNLVRVMSIDVYSFLLAVFYLVLDSYLIIRDS